MTNVLLADSRAGFGLLTFMFRKTIKGRGNVEECDERIEYSIKDAGFFLEQKWMMLIVEDHIAN